MTSVLVTGLILAVAYVLVCARWYHKACRVCGGSGRSRSPFRDGSWRPCGWCGGSGKRKRIGRLIYEACGGGDPE